MDNAANALIFFYGVFWAAALSSLGGKFHAFNSAAATSGTEKWKACKRWIVSFVVANLMPAALIALLYWGATKWAIWPPLGVAAAAFAAFSTFAISRLLHWIIATGWKDCFYGAEEWRALSGLHAEEPKATTEKDGLPKAQSWGGHCVGGIAYFVVPLLLALALGFCGHIRTQRSALIGDSTKVDELIAKLSAVLDANGTLQQLRREALDSQASANSAINEFRVSLQTSDKSADFQDIRGSLSELKQQLGLIEAAIAKIDSRSSPAPRAPGSIQGDR